MMSFFLICTINSFNTCTGNGKDLLPYVEPVVTPGHEFSGTVVQLGEQADKVTISYPVWLWKLVTIRWIRIGSEPYLKIMNH